jgi:hypothetical protein
MPAEITDRDADVWEPLLAVADLVGGEWPAMARAAAVALFAAAQDAEPSLGVRLLADLRTIFGAEEFLSTGAILVKLHAMEEAPWGDLHGKPIDSRGLAKRLRPYGIKPEVARIDNASTARGYQRASLDDQWLRYLPPLPARSETNETTETCAPSAIVRELPVTDVTHVTGDRGRELPDLDDDDPRWLSEIR